MIQKQDKEARKREEELARHQNQLFEAFRQWFLVPRGGNRPGPVLEYARQFDHLLQYAPNMVCTTTRKNVSMGIGSGQKEVFQTSPL